MRNPRDRQIIDAIRLASGGGAWTRKEGKNPEGGLNEKGRASLRAQGHDIKRPQPEGGARKDSFCARMKGMKAKLTSSDTANDPDSRINKSLRKWKCADGGALSVARQYREQGGISINETDADRERLIEEILKKQKQTKTPSSKQSTSTPGKPSSATPSISKEEYNKGMLGYGAFALSKGGKAYRKGYSTGGDPLDQGNPYLDQVNSLYQNIFGRKPDEAGANYWANKLETSPMTLEDIQNLFSTSQEAQNRFGDIVQQAYRNNLARNADEGGLNYWTDMLRSGKASLGDIEAELSTSQEAKLNRLYHNELGRDLEIEGRDYWLNQLNEGKASFEDVENAIHGSQEAKLHRGKTDHTSHGIPKFSDPAEALGKLMWSEGDLFRGKPNAEKELSGIGWTVRNRADSGFTGNMPKWYRAGHDPNNIIDQITAPSAYSHFNKTRSKMAEQAFEKDPSLRQYYTGLAQKILNGEIDDPTEGSISYYNPKVVKTPGFAAKKGLKEGFYKSTTLDADPSGQYHVYYGHNKYTPAALSKQYERTHGTPLPSTPPSQPSPVTPIIAPPTSPGGGIPISGYDGGYGVVDNSQYASGGNFGNDAGISHPSAPHTAPHAPVTHTPVTHVGGGSHPSSGDHGSFGVSYGDAGGVGDVGGGGHGAVDPYFGHGGTQHHSGIPGHVYSYHNLGGGGWNSDGSCFHGMCGSPYEMSVLKRGGRINKDCGGALANAMDVSRAYKKGGPVWDKPRPKSLGKPDPLSKKQKSSAKAMAKAAGRPYPNLIDNMRAARQNGGSVEVKSIADALRLAKYR
jgi:hypothetical protein